MRCMTFVLVWSALAWCAAEARAADNQLSSQEKKEGWVLLFDGTLKGWITNEKKPSQRPVEDGCLNPHKCGGYLLVHEKEWSDFAFAFDFKISPRCNSGVFFRTSPLIGDTSIAYHGLEIQILDSKRADFHDTGAIYDLVKPTKNAMKPAGEWNHMVITCVDNLITVEVNGEKVNHMDLNEWPEKGKRPDGTQHKFDDRAWKSHPRTGYLGFQDHGRDCWFKNVKIKPLARAGHTASAPAAQ